MSVISPKYKIGGALLVDVLIYFRCLNKNTIFGYIDKNIVYNFKCHHVAVCLGLSFPKDKALKNSG